MDKTGPSRAIQRCYDEGARIVVVCGSDRADRTAAEEAFEARFGSYFEGGWVRLKGAALETGSIRTSLVGAYIGDALESEADAMIAVRELDEAESGAFTPILELIEIPAEEEREDLEFRIALRDFVAIADWLDNSGEPGRPPG